MEMILSVLAQSAFAGIMVWYFTYIKKRVDKRFKDREAVQKQQFHEEIEGIRQRYREATEQLRHQFELETEQLKHKLQLEQLQRSLLFDHLRTAFEEILAGIATLIRKFEEEYEPGPELFCPIPYSAFEDLKSIVRKHNLLLDNDCETALEILTVAVLRGCSPWDPEGNQPDDEDCSQAYGELNYLASRVADLFRAKLGYSQVRQPMLDFAIFGGVQLINRYHFGTAFPTKGKFARANFSSVESIVETGKREAAELARELELFLATLAEDPTTEDFFMRTHLKASRYLDEINGYAAFTYHRTELTGRAHEAQ
jgi:hypothetical protein